MSQFQARQSSVQDQLDTLRQALADECSERRVDSKAMLANIEAVQLMRSRDTAAYAGAEKPPTMRQYHELVTKCREEAAEAARQAGLCTGTVEEMKSKCVAALEEVKGKLENSSLASSDHIASRMATLEAEVREAGDVRSIVGNCAVSVQRLERSVEQRLERVEAASGESRQFVEQRLKQCCDDLVNVWKTLETGEHVESMCRKFAAEFERSVVKQVVDEAIAEQLDFMRSEVAQGVSGSSERLPTTADIRESNAMLRAELESLTTRLQHQSHSVSLADAEDVREQLDGVLTLVQTSAQYQEEAARKAAKGDKTRHKQMMSMDQQIARLEEKLEAHEQELEDLRAEEARPKRAVDLKVARLSEKVDIHSARLSAVLLRTQERQASGATEDKAVSHPGRSRSPSLGAERRVASRDRAVEAEVLTSLQALRDEITRLRSADQDFQEAARTARMVSAPSELPQQLQSPQLMSRTASPPPKQTRPSESYRFLGAHASSVQRQSSSPSRLSGNSNVQRLLSSPQASSRDMQQRPQSSPQASNREVQRLQSSPQATSREVQSAQSSPLVSSREVIPAFPSGNNRSGSYNFLSNSCVSVATATLPNNSHTQGLHSSVRMRQPPGSHYKNVTR